MINKYPNIVFLGAPGSGKGTLAQDLVKELNYKHFSTGDMFRHTAKEDTALGRQIKVLMTTGNLISDDITNQMVEKYIKEAIAKNEHFILDGYPRTKNQAEFLKNIDPTLEFYVIYLDIDWSLAAKRIIGRLSCPNCHAVYNSFFKPPKETNKCDKCGSDLICRKDDHVETAQNRYKVYMQLTQPLIDYYKQNKNFYTIKIDENTNVYKQTLEILNQVK